MFADMKLGLLMKILHTYTGGILEIACQRIGKVVFTPSILWKNRVKNTEAIGAISISRVTSSNSQCKKSTAHIVLSEV